ncbi:MAG: F0F1 ATP synthase subunit B [Dehalococcoidales bacterium]|nr:F0F1 ATP synthase subunit B [Dehalococcoidales bacterium]
MSGIAQLGISVPTLVAQVINVVVLLVLLRLVAYKPLMKMLDKRSQKIKESLEQAEAIKAKSTNAEEDIKKQFKAASLEAQERIARAAKIGEELKLKAQQDARQEAEVLIGRARSEIQRERDEAIGELRRAFADLTVLAAGKVIDRSLDKEAHRDLINKMLEESSLKKG